MAENLIKDYRSTYLNTRNQFSKEYILDGSNRIINNFMALLESDFKGANIFLCYYPFGSEVNLLPLYTRLLTLGKRLYFPKCMPGHKLKFFQVLDLNNDFEVGFKNILEPKEGLPVLEDFSEDTVVITPGLVFDNSFNRIGYGGGFYDRFFAEYQKVKKVAVAFDFQVLPAIAIMEHDIKVDYIVTDDRILKGHSMSLIDILTKSKEAKYKVALLSTEDKNKAILAVADALVSNADFIIKANQIDVEMGIKKGLKEGLIDRLRLDESRIQSMSEGLRQVVSLEDPIGKVTESWERPNGLKISKRLTPIGVVGVIYEARPNVTVDVFGLCFKTGNAVVLKGGSDALESNKAIVKVIKDALKANNMPVDAITLIEDTTRETTNQLMRMNGYVDVLIPRGGAGLIKSVVENASVPVIETGSGNCHIYVDYTYDSDMALDIIENAKTQRIGVCNACESLVIHKDIAKEFLPKLNERLHKHNVKIYAHNESRQYLQGSFEASEEDFATEYLDYMISVKTVASVEEAIEHINKYNTGHSESIITKDETNANKFLDGIDAACVYVNASTRFTDGFEFGFGAEIGISTQKLHARGPMGLLALTSYKYTILGNGQIRK